MNLIEYPDREMLAIDLANLLAGDLENALFNHDRVSFAVPGGTTPGPVFDALCAADLDWSRVDVLPGDERWVSPTHARSNAAQIRARLLRARAAAARLVPLYLEGCAPEAAVADLSAALAPVLPLDVLLVGMGEDMHTASLFPGADGLEAALDPDAPPVAVLRPASQPEARMSLSAPVLDGALAKHLVIFGAGKRAALERAATLPANEAPVGAILQGMTIHWAE